MACDTDSVLTWGPGDLPVSRVYDDPYFSGLDGLAEKRHVFLQGNRLPQRWVGATGFAIGELGFGTGLAVLAAWALWQQLAAPGAVLRVTSFEIAPLPGPAIARALAPWPELAPLTARLLGVWRGAGRYDLGDLVLDLVPGDARQTVPKWDGRADAWFLDGFAPTRNPQMWEPDLLAAVHARTVPGGTFATYSAAGALRRNLAKLGYNVTKIQGFGPKRDMTVGVRPDMYQTGT